MKVDIDGLVIQDVCASVVGVTEISRNLGLSYRLDTIVVEEEPGAVRLDDCDIMTVMRAAKTDEINTLMSAIEVTSSLSDMDYDGEEFV